MELWVNGQQSSPDLSTCAVVLASGTIEATRLALDSFPTALMGRNLMAHFRTTPLSASNGPLSTRIANTRSRGDARARVPPSAAITCRSRAAVDRGEFGSGYVADDSGHRPGSPDVGLPTARTGSLLPFEASARWGGGQTRQLPKSRAARRLVDLSDQTDDSAGAGRGSTWWQTWTTRRLLEHDGHSRPRTRQEVGQRLFRRSSSISTKRRDGRIALLRLARAVTVSAPLTTRRGLSGWYGIPATSVTILYGRFHHVSNVYVAGPAVFPTLGSANPSPTALGVDASPST